MDKNTPEGNSHSELIIYAGLACTRIFLALAPQTGYIHPDEYFQSLEVVLGDVYQIRRSKIWEFDDEFPIRNAFIPYFLYGIPCYIMKVILQIFQFYGPVSPYLLVIPPRLVMCALSFLVDFSLLRICQKYKTDAGGRLALLASSCVMLVFATRTFSNTVEMILFSLLLYVIVENIIESERVYPVEDKLKASLDAATNPRDKVLILRQLKQISHHTHSGFWQISLLTVFGMFNRPTFIAFAIGPIFFWLYRGAPLRKISFYTVQIRLCFLLSVGLPLAAALIICDTIYYKRDKALDIVIHHGLGTCLNRFIECLEITPLNFLRYNFHTDNLAKHGLHPRYLHLLVNIPLLYNVLGVSVLFMIASIFLKILRRRLSNLPKFDSITGLMFGSIIIPLTVLSLAPHQEPRFLIPLTLPLIFLKGMKMNNKVEDTDYSFRNLFGNRFSKKMVFIWCLGNAAVVFFFGFSHQAGILPSINHVTNIRYVLKDTARIHVVPSYTYTLPMTLLTATIYDEKTWNPPVDPSEHPTLRQKLSGILPATILVFTLFLLRDIIFELWGKVNLGLTCQSKCPASSLGGRHIAKNFSQDISSRSNVMLYPTSSSNFHTSMKLLEAVIQSVERQPPYDDLVYFLFPTSLTTNFTSHPILKRLKVRYVIEYYYLLHTSTEALPQPSELLYKIGLNAALLRSVKFVHSHTKDPFVGYFAPQDNPSFDQLFSNF